MTYVNKKATTDEKKDYKIVSLKFVVYDNGNIAVLDKKEEELVDIKEDAVVMVYKDNSKIAEAIPKAIKKLSGTPDVAEAKGDDMPVTEESQQNGKELLGSTENNAETNEVVNNMQEGPASNNETEDGKYGGARRAYPKNVSFSKKYPKNKSNKKTLRNLQRIASY